MTLEDIIRMAREADQGHAGMECEQFGGGIVSVSTLERFAELVAAAEREATDGAAQCPDVAAPGATSAHLCLILTNHSPATERGSFLEK